MLKSLHKYILIWIPVWKFKSNKSLQIKRLRILYKSAPPHCHTSLPGQPWSQVQRTFLLLPNPDINSNNNQVRSWPEINKNCTEWLVPKCFLHCFWRVQAYDRFEQWTVVWIVSSVLHKFSWVNSWNLRHNLRSAIKKGNTALVKSFY